MIISKCIDNNNCMRDKMNSKPHFKKRWLTASRGNSDRTCPANTKRKRPEDVQEKESDEEDRISLRKETTSKKRKPSPKKVTSQKKPANRRSERRKKQTSTKTGHPDCRAQHSVLSSPSKHTEQNYDLKQENSETKNSPHSSLEVDESTFLFMKEEMSGDDGFSTSCDMSEDKGELKNTKQQTGLFYTEPDLFDDFESQWSNSEEHESFQNKKHVVKTYSRTIPYVIFPTKSGFNISESEDIFSDQETEVPGKCLPSDSSGTNPDVSELCNSCPTLPNLQKSHLENKPVIRTYSQTKLCEASSLSVAKSDVPSFEPQGVSNQNVFTPKRSFSKRSKFKKQMLFVNVHEEDKTYSLKIKTNPYASTSVDIDSDIVKVYSKDYPDAESQNISDSNPDVLLLNNFSPKLQKQKLREEKKQAIKTYSRSKACVKLSIETPNKKNPQRRMAKTESQNASLGSSPNVKPNNSVPKLPNVHKRSLVLKRKKVNVRKKLSLDKASVISSTNSMANTEELAEIFSEGKAEHSTSESQNSNPDVVESNIGCDKELNDVVPQIKHVSNTYSRISQSGSVLIKTEESKILNPDALESKICSPNKSIDVISQIKHVSQTYSRIHCNPCKPTGKKVSQNSPEHSNKEIAINKPTRAKLKTSRKKLVSKNVVPKLEVEVKPVNEPKTSSTKLRKRNAKEITEVHPMLKKEDEADSPDFEAAINDKENNGTLSSSEPKNSIVQQDDEEILYPQTVVPQPQLGVKSVNNPKTSSTKPRKRKAKKDTEVLSTLKKDDETYSPDFEPSTDDKERNANMISSELKSPSLVPQDDGTKLSSTQPQLDVKSVSKPKTSLTKLRKKNGKKIVEFLPVSIKEDKTYSPDFEASTNSNDKEKNGRSSSELKISSTVPQNDEKKYNLRCPPNTKQEKQSKVVHYKLRNKSKNTQLDISKDCESLDVQNSETQLKKKPIQNKCKKSVVTKPMLNRSSIEDCESPNKKQDESSHTIKSEQPKRKRVSASKNIPCKARKVSVSQLCVDEQKSNYTNSSMEDTDFDFLPMIIDNSKNKLKMIVSTAVQFQRQSRRQLLTEEDFRKSLAFHKLLE